MLCLLCVWGFRLTNNFYARGGIGNEDWRYVDMREKFGKHFWWISLFSVFLGQTVFLFLPCLSLYGAIESEESLGVLDWVGGATMFVAIMLETVSDQQMNNFIDRKKAGFTTEPVISEGLWRYSRHPNYLGEILVWWGLYFFSLTKTEAWKVCGPISITLLFVCISVRLMEDRQLENKGEAFKRYQQEVGSPLLLLPPAVNRWIGGLCYK